MSRKAISITPIGMRSQDNRREANIKECLIHCMDEGSRSTLERRRAVYSAVADCSNKGRHRPPLKTWPFNSQVELTALFTLRLSPLTTNRPRCIQARGYEQVPGQILSRTTNRGCALKHRPRGRRDRSFTVRGQIAWTRPASGASFSHSS